jgi:hypothetical protein
METTNLLLRVRRADIVTLLAILNGYDNLVSVRTLDQVRGIINIAISPGCEAVVGELLDSLKPMLPWEEWPEVSDISLLPDIQPA